ncbi:MAG: SRPBCC domain-containing protein [Treponema sp.]|nr:SRPBCC domain-containing protein [Treponema sp.]
MAGKKIRVETTVDLPLATVWELWNNPEHVTKWYFASPDWHAPKAANDLRAGGAFNIRMEARDGSFGFDFAGTYTKIEKPTNLECRLGDGRSLDVKFSSLESRTVIVEEFEMEMTNSEERQRAGWQAILDNFKRYAESI